jgi:hypothetical protein
VTWRAAGGDVRVRQDTAYPDAETTTLTFTMASPATFTVKFRVPSWARGAHAAVNGTAAPIDAAAGAWAAVSRTWQAGNRLVIGIPLALRMLPVDRRRVARCAQDTYNTYYA